MRELYKAKLNIDDRNGTKVICPICGCENAHFGEVQQNTEIAGGNQGNISIEFLGECGHKWLMIFAGHKGDLYRAVVPISEWLNCTNPIVLD